MAGQKLVAESGPRDRSRRLAAILHLEEQISLLAGKDFWRTVGFPSKGIPSIKFTDGPNGARGEFFTDGTPAALFPCGVSLAATWNVNLLREVGEHLAAETKARGAHVLLAPTVCLHRSPLGGRNFESFSEDPLLTGKLASAYISGLQSRGVAATIKHFVGNEQETHRQTIDSRIGERPLRELYLKPFEIAVREANPWALMTAYNLVNGVHADMNMHTLQDILRGEWKYEGMVMSDWTGTNSVVDSIAAGCDLEMPGPTVWRGERALEAIKNGTLSAKHVERSAANVLYLVDRSKGLDGPGEQPERSDDVPERRSLIRRLGHEGLTLLKNDGVLPLHNNEQTIALIGPNAARAVSHGGGSASVKPYYTTSPLEGLQAASRGKILYSQGCDTRKFLPLLSDSHCISASGKPGITLEYYHGDRFQGEPAHIVHRNGSDLFLWDSAPLDVLPAYSFKAHCTFTPKTSGSHTFGFMSVGPGRLYVNDDLLIDNWDWMVEGETMFGGSVEAVKHVNLPAGQPVHVFVESNNQIRPRSKVLPDGPHHWYGGCRIGFEEEQKVDLLAEAVQTAKAADVAVVCVGLDAEWESEGYDRTTMALPRDGSQDMLIAAVAAANPRTVVFNQSGTPVNMLWADSVAGILQGWYGGQEAGHALADVLFGLANPSGKLPDTFPVRLEDNPAYHNWPGENRQVEYGEGIFVGYRHYERVDCKPKFPFGHGLSYTSFEYGQVTLSDSVLWGVDEAHDTPTNGHNGVNGAVRNGTNGTANGSTNGSSTKQGSERIAVCLRIRNTGPVAGSETVQLYVRDVEARVTRPQKELQAFAKVSLQPGEEKTVEMSIDKHAVGFYDTSVKKWVAEEGEFQVLVGASSQDIRAQGTFEVKQTFSWIF